MIDKLALEKKAKELQEEQESQNQGTTRGNTSIGLNRKIKDTVPTKFDNFHSNFINNYVPEEMKTDLMGDIDKEKFRKDILRYGKRSKYRVGRICVPEECLDAKLGDCPFIKLGKEKYIPCGKRCPMELMEIDALIDAFRNLFINEYNVDKNMVEIHIRDLVVVEININRINEQIADRGLLESAPIFALPKSETIVDGKIASPLFEIQEKLLKRRERIYKSMLITPEAKARYNLRSDKDIASILAEIKKRAEDNISRYKESGTGKPDNLQEIITVDIEKEDKEERD